MDKVNFEFYHGTSSIFLNSIIKYGLGGINPNYKYKHLDALKFLWELCEDNFSNNPNYLIIRDTTTAMVKQCKLEIIHPNGKKEIYNFRHDGIHIALSLQKAVSYASINKYGGEIVCTCIRLMDILQEGGIMYDEPNELPFSFFKKIRQLDLKPIIIKINKVNEHKLDKEDGKTAKEAIDFLRSINNTLSEEQKFIFYQHCNFKLLKPIKTQDLEFYELDCYGRYGNKDFEYTMTKMDISNIPSENTLL